jgi:hypothetical protein
LGYDAHVILATSLPRRRRVNSGRYDEPPTSRNARPRFRSRRRNFKIFSSPKRLGHTETCITETLTNLGYTLLPHPSPNPTVLTLHHQIFTICLLKDSLLGRHYMDEALQNTVQQWRASFTCR